MSPPISGKPKSAIIKDILRDNLWLFYTSYRYLLWHLRKSVQDEIVLNTQHGMLKFSLRDPVIGRCLYMFGHYEYAYSLRCLQFLKNEKFLGDQPVHLFDIGANIGFISIGLMHAGLIDQATAVEPESRNFGFLNEDIRLNGFEQRINTVQCAVSEKEKTVSFEIVDKNYGGHHIVSKEQAVSAKTVDVKCLPLDKLCEQYGKPSVIWIDIEGFEGYAFRGGKQILSERIPVVSEIFPDAIKRSGMTLDEFKSIISEYWSRYWVERGESFISYPVASIDSYFDELASNSSLCGNVIFTV